MVEKTVCESAKDAHACYYSDGGSAFGYKNLEPLTGCKLVHGDSKIHDGESTPGNPAKVGTKNVNW